MRSLKWLAVGALLAGGLGCGSSENYAPVSGRVTVNGAPLANADVSFQPMGDADHPNPGRASYGKTDAGGSFTLRVVGLDEKAAAVGKHRVVIWLYRGERSVEESASTIQNVLPERYNLQSELTFEVPEAGADAANFDLTYP
jgi:hypothetical protein